MAKLNLLTSINPLLLLLSLLLMAPCSYGQRIVERSAYLYFNQSKELEDQLFISLDTLFDQIRAGRLDPQMVGNSDNALSKSIFGDYQNIFKSLKGGPEAATSLQVINCYAVEANQYLMSISCMYTDQHNVPTLRAVISLVASYSDGHFLFSIPLSHLTSNWKTRRFGDVTYYYSDSINKMIARSFNKKNTRIALKLGLQPEKLNFYMTSDYQQVMSLLGYNYDAASNGKTRDGYGVDAHTIFAIRHNEDFSHDLVHHYIGLIRTNSRNAAAEEGLAYYWGNAYYTGAGGRMLDLDKLAKALRQYLVLHPDTNLLMLFTANAKIFPQFAKEVSARAVIAGVLCGQIEKQSGMPGILSLVNCGPGDENYFRILNTLIAVNPQNFETKVRFALDRLK